ncbi:MAG TPA: TolC family protein, partial [Nitrospira sp.]
MKLLRLSLTLGALVLSAISGPLNASAADGDSAKGLPAIPLSVDEIHAWIDRSHPLLKGAGTEKVMAR